MAAAMVKVEVDASGAEAALGEIDAQTLDGVLRLGLAEALTYAADEVVMEGNAKRLQRTGTLLSSIRGVLDEGSLPRGVVGVAADSPAASYAWLLTDELRTIVPVNASALTIPIASNLTGSGVPRFPSVAALRAEHGDKVRRKGNVIGVIADGHFEAMFALVKSVSIDGRNVFEPALDRAVPEMVETIQDRVDRMIEGMRSA